MKGGRKSTKRGREGWAKGERVREKDVCVLMCGSYRVGIG